MSSPSGPSSAPRRPSDTRASAIPKDRERVASLVQKYEQQASSSHITIPHRVVAGLSRTLSPTFANATPSPVSSDRPRHTSHASGAQAKFDGPERRLSLDVGSAATPTAVASAFLPQIPLATPAAPLPIKPEAKPSPTAASPTPAYFSAILTSPSRINEFGASPTDKVEAEACWPSPAVQIKQPELKIYSAPTLVNPSLRPVHVMGRGMEGNLPLESEMKAVPKNMPKAGDAKDDQLRAPRKGRELNRMGDSDPGYTPDGPQKSSGCPNREVRDGIKKPRKGSDKRGPIPSGWLSGRLRPNPSESWMAQGGKGENSSPVVPASHQPTVSQEMVNSTPLSPMPLLHSKVDCDPFADLPTTDGSSRHYHHARPSGTAGPNPFTSPADDDADGEDGTEDADQDTSHDEAGSSRRSTRPSPSRVPMLSTASVRPIPAADVFAPNAMPLHLPQLEVYLSDRDLFAEPLFSDAQVLATETERLLYGYDDATAATAREGGDQDGRKYKPRENGSKSGSGKMEAAGGQFVIPRAAIRLHFKGSSHGKQDQDKRGVAQSGDKLSTEAEEDTEEEEEAGLLDVQTGPPSAPQTETTGTSVPTISAGVPSSLSTASHPVTRLEMFPPMMLLKDMGGLRELKSNAVGPRAPPGGLLSSVPGLGSLLGTVIDFMIGMEGSSFAANLISLELVRDFAQLMANQLQFSSSPYVTQTSSTMARFIFLRLPQIIALDFVSVFGKAAIFFIIWIVFTTLALWRFYRMTSVSDPNREVEGYDSQPYIFSSPKRGTKVANIFIVFVLTGLYIPLTKLSVDALTWSSAWWVVANPYTADVDNPSLPPLGDAHLYRDPLDFCWTTTMRKDEFNFAWIILPFAILSILFYTLWFPYRMLVTIKAMLPRVAEYNELGHKRSEAAMQEKYYLLLSRDKSPLNFMYNAYRRRWGFYKPLYILCFKLVNTFIIAFFTKSNCVWRSFAAKTMLVSQQIVLLVVMSILCVIHFFLQPFVDAISNRSEMVSRFGYVATAIIGLLVALQVDGSTVYNTTILYIVEGVMYTLTIYFSLAGTSWFAHWVKRTQRRFDFSIDIFSPLLNIDKHIKRRIWQETLSTILLCGPGYQMPQDQVIAFSTSDTDKWPPYLLWFEGTVAERHVENLKILKAIGLRDYRRAVQYRRSHVAERLRNVTRTIQTEFAGPDAYWHPIRPPYPDGVSSWFGKAFLVPFPPTLVIRYDQGSSETIQLDTLEEMERFIEQNSSEPVQSKRMVRRVLRALEGQTVFCPYNDMAYFGADVRPALLNRRKNRYTLARPTAYNEGILRISHRQRSDFAGYNFSSGFRVTITYYEGQRQDPAGLTRVRKQVEVHASSAFGLHDDFEMTPHLIQFFRDNEHIIRSRLPVIDDVLANYRRHFYCEAREKERVLSYAFLTDIFDNVQLTPAELMLALRRSGCCRDVRRLSSEYQAAVTVLYERMCAVNRSLVHRWWWLFWDDLWRKNAGDYQRLRAHRRVLSPHYPTSIAYRPMPRLQLEKFLKSRGLWSGAGGGKASLFTRGLLNRIYFQLDQLVFAGPNADGTGGSAAAIPVGLGHTPDDVQRIAYSTIKQHDLNLARGSVPDLPAAGRVAHHAGDADGEYGDPSTTLLSLRGRAGVGSALSSQLTGGGTSYDQQSIITRPAFAWERRMLFLTPSLSRLERVRNRLLEWLSLHPFIVDPAARALFLYLSIEEGRYTLPSVHWKQPAVEGAFSVAAAAEPTAATVKVMMPAPPTTTTLDAHTVTIHANVFSMPPSRARMIAGSPGAAAEEDVRDDGEAVQLTRLSAR